MSDGPTADVDPFDQRPYRIRLGWGPNGLRRLAPVADVVVIVDVLSFSTAVDIALGRGAAVLPYRWHDGTEAGYASDNDATLAEKRPAPGKLSLRPSSLAEVEPGTRLVLPSPNGSALAFAAAEAGASTVVVGCLRNAAAVAGLIMATGGVVAVIPAGERWRGATGPLRPAIEDLLGAGAVVAGLTGGVGLLGVDECSPEALVAKAAFLDAAPDLTARLQECGSGRELIDRGYEADVALAADHDVSPVAPILVGPELVDGAV